MPMFKPKNTKKIIICDKSNITLDTKHKEMLNKFDNESTIMLPELKLEKKKIKDKLKNSILKIDEILDLNDKLKDINEKISKLKKKKMDYFLENSKYIHEYFENKKKIAEGTNKTTILNNFFKINKNITNNNDKEITDIQKYLTNVDENFLNIKNFVYQKDICSNCNNGEMISIEHEGLLVCNKCSHCIRFLVENEKPSYKEPPKEVCFYAYKRINHFREILAQFQAKETTQIPDIVLEDIKLQIKKERINLAQLTNKKAKEILKKLGYNKYYEHIPFIKDKLGIKPPIMNSELEDTLCNLFLDIQGPYAKYCPDYRVNFLNYYYTVYKLCELLDQKQFLPYFPMLKDREKRIEQDEIWKQICNELDWEFIPTI